MYSRNLRGQRERPLQIPENYSGSFLFPNTRMPNPPPIYRSDEKAHHQSSHRKESTYVKVRPADKEKLREHREDTERQSQGAHRDEIHAERQSERPWYDGNVYGLRGEYECDECERDDKHAERTVRNEYRGYDEREDCTKDECRDAHGDSQDDCEGCDINECREEREGGDGHGDKSRPNFSSLIPQSFLPPLYTY